MGIQMRIPCCRKNHEYFKLLDKTLLKKLSEIKPKNKKFAFISNKFKLNEINLSLNFENFNMNWKTYILFQLNPDDSVQNWKSELYKNFENQYFFQNYMYYEELSILTMPDIDKKIELYDIKDQPILTSLEPKELNSLYKHMPKFDIIQPLDEQNDLIESTTGLDTKKDNDSTSSKLTMDYSFDIINESRIEQSVENKFIYNSNRIKKYMKILKSHLENETHPLKKIIEKFVEKFYPQMELIKENISNIKNNLDNSDDLIRNAKGLIKQLQIFIEIMHVTLKLFYIKSIDYRNFEDEKDEIINLIIYILFNEPKIYNPLEEIFDSMNSENMEKLEEQFKIIGDITPSDAGIEDKFCLNEKSNKYKNNSIEDKDEDEIKTQRKTTRPLILFMKNDIEIKGVKEKIRTYDKEEDKNLIVEDNNQYDKFKNKLESCKTYRRYSDYIKKSVEYPIILNKNEEEENDIVNKEPYQIAINYLKQIDQYKSPMEKLTILALISVLISDCIDKYYSVENNKHEKGYKVEADELISIYLYIIYKTKMPKLFVQLEFMKYFTTPATRLSLIGYYYIALESCLKFILKVKDKKEFLYNKMYEY